MGNSPLVTYTRLTKKCTSPRNHAIDTITIHCIVGQWTAKQGCDYFATTDRRCSVNYIVGKDGSIGLCVEEKNASWCSWSSANDNRAITIEVASDTKPPYAVTDKAYNALIELCADICRRNGIKRLLWQNDKKLIGQTDKQNMTVHRWFKDTDCPGEYLLSRHGDIAQKVNSKLSGEPPDVTSSEAVSSPINTGTPIMGAPKLSAAQLEAFLLKKNAAPKLNGVTAKRLAELYISEGNAEGVRGDLAFCQGALETGYWTFKGDVKPSQNNFAGIGATGGGNPGNSFADAQTGVRAQIQHLKAYASKEALKNACVDPRYRLVDKGCAPTIEGLSGRWASDKKYADKIKAIYNEASGAKGTEGAKTYTVKVTANKLNVRTGPGTNYKVIRTIKDHSSYEVSEERNGWGKIRDGWIFLAYTKRI